ncbi:MAG: HAMP domain-containing histidine kinase [Bacteroidetes bacterium]|nr:HAMP domain-containing histidine kinase [Bacteroidota bacterium]
MKLFSKYNRLNIAATICIFIIGSCTFYFLLRYILVHQVDEALDTEKEEIFAYLDMHHSLPEIVNTEDQLIVYRNSNKLYKPQYYNYYVEKSGHGETFRQLKFSVNVHDKYFTITVSKSLEETEALLQIIIGVTVCMIALILLVGYFINRRVLNKLWQPFYDTIQKVQTYNISEKREISLAKTGIEEFTLLNQSISEMTRRVQSDYQSLKEFTGHAAHEIQTPLAIIRNRMDMIIQDEIVLINHTQQIVDIEKAVSRLSKLHQSLLLLTKVEHRQFILNEQVKLNGLIEDKIAEFRDLIDSRSITVKTHLEPVSVLFHQQLAEIVVSNLLNNAVRYNRTGGNIEIILEPGKLEIANTSNLLKISQEKLFQRFYRDPDVGEEGTGLGLTIVKQICEMAGYTLKYDFVSDRHIFSIAFQQST